MPNMEDDVARADPGADSLAHEAPAGEPSDVVDPPPAPWAEGRALHPKLRTLLRAGAPEPRSIRRFLARHALPLVEPDAVTFLHHGEAEAVRLRHFMNGMPNGTPLERIPGTALWHLRLALPEATRFEYKLEVVRHGHGAWINDPLNPEVATDPFGANSVGHSVGHAPPAWTRPDPEAPAGRLEEIAVDSRAFREKRSLRVYLPAGLEPGGACPLVILHDGEDFVAHADLVTALDNLIHRGKVPPFVAALPQPGERNREYTGDPRHARFLTDELLPALRERLPVRRDPAGTVLMGASLGAVASLATAFRYPGVYGAVALMSGSFVFDRGLLKTRDPLFTRVADFVDRLWDGPGRLPPRAFVGCGVHEGLIGQNRVLARFLREQRVAVRVVETRDAHHWQNWRDQLGASLRWTLPRA